MDRKSNEMGLPVVNEGRSVLKVIEKTKANMIGCVLRHNQSVTDIYLPI